MTVTHGVMLFPLITNQNVMNRKMSAASAALYAPKYKRHQGLCLGVWQ